jgi:hypothetical protein
MNRDYRASVIFGALPAIGVLSGTSAAHADTWRGTAPFCSGKCLPGEQEIARSKTGDGSSCWSGHKVLCRNMEQSCIPNDPPTTECDVFVLVCDNGCSSYACGACIFSEGD